MIAPKSHIHIYNNKYDKKDKFAYPIDPIAFPIVDDFQNVYISFLEFNNIKVL